MTPVSVPEYSPLAIGAQRIVFAENQPEYNPLPALRFGDGCVVTRWQLTWRERLQVLLGRGIFLSLLTFNQPLQPMKLGTKFEDVL